MTRKVRFMEVDGLTAGERIVLQEAAPTAKVQFIPAPFPRFPPNCPTLTALLHSKAGKNRKMPKLNCTFAVRLRHIRHIREQREAAVLSYLCSCAVLAGPVDSPGTSTAGSLILLAAGRFSIRASTFSTASLPISSSLCRIWVKA